MDAARTFFEMDENIVGIVAVLNYFGLSVRFYHSPLNDIAPYFLATDPKTGAHLSFWCDAPSEQVRRSIIASRQAFGFQSKISAVNMSLSRTQPCLPESATSAATLRQQGAAD